VGGAEGGRAIGRRKSHHGEETDGWAMRRRTGMQGGGRRRGQRPEEDEAGVTRVLYLVTDPTIEGAFPHR
jgi:hypothetical protein